MKNGKQIAFTQLSFQPFLGKLVTFYSVSKTNFVEYLNLHFVFIGYFTHDQICNLSRDYDLKYWKIYYAYISVTSRERWYSITFVIKNLLFVQYVQLQNFFLKFVFPSIFRISSKYSTKQHTFAHFLRWGYFLGSTCIFVLTVVVLFSISANRRFALSYRFWFGQPRSSRTNHGNRRWVW